MGPLDEFDEKMKFNTRTELWTVLLDILVIVFNLFLIGLTSVLKLTVNVIRKLNMGSVSNQVACYRQEHSQCSQYYSDYNGQSYMKTSQYANVEITPCQKLSHSVVHKSWSISQLKSQVENLQRENLELKYKIENSNLTFHKHREDMLRQIQSLRTNLEEISAQRHEWEKIVKENANTVSELDSNNGENLELSFTGTEIKVSEPEGIISEEDKNDASMTTEQQASEVKKRRNNLTLAKHVCCKDILF
ncbi:hypothetical protein M8J76_002934 [Diaphorina citri]|nr:hypothetical protein M8J75_013634 [Diaphorina citri]KAI5736413.1 hypothetical protein M8J76_002934 [Diaphorina citri]